MDNFTTLIPAASFVAILLFILREASSLINSWIGKKRELKALSMILAEELAHNYFVGQQISSAVDIINGKQQVSLRFEKDELNYSYSFEEYSSGNVRFVCSSSELWTSFPIFKVETQRYEASLSSVVKLNTKLFHEVSDVYRRIVHLSHTKDELFYWVEHQMQMDDDLLEVKAEFLNENDIETTLNEIKELYNTFTGEEIPKNFKIS